MRRWFACTLLLVTVCAIGSAIVLPGTLFAQMRPGAGGEPVGMCATRVSGQIEQLPCPIVVIGQPKTIRITKYPPGDRNGKPVHPALSVVATIRQPSQVASLVHLLNQSRWFPFGEKVFCLGDLGYLYLLRLTYANGDRWTVSAETDTCHDVYAHGVVAAAQPDLVRYLNALGGLPPQASARVRR